MGQPVKKAKYTIEPPDPPASKYTIEPPEKAAPAPSSDNIGGGFNLGRIGNAINNFEDATIGTHTDEGVIKGFTEGVPYIVKHPIDSAKLIGGSILGSHADTANDAVAQMKQPGVMNKVVGAGRYIQSGIPGAGPLLDKAGKQLENGDVSGGIGTTLGVGSMIAAPKIAESAPKIASAAGDVITSGRRAVGGKLQNTAYNTMNNVLGIYGRDLKYDINPGRGVVEEGIAGANKKSLLKKIDAAVPPVAEKLNATANLPEVRGRVVNLDSAVNKPFDTALSEGDLAPSSYLNRVRQTQKELTQHRIFDENEKPQFTGRPIDLTMNVPDALNYKRGIGRRTNFESDAEGQNITPLLREAYGLSNREINRVAPETAPFNQRLADLQTAGSSLDATLGRRLASPSSIGFRETAPAIVGNAVGGAPAAAAAIAGGKLISSVPFKTYGAQLLNKTGKFIAGPTPKTPIPVDIGSIGDVSPVLIPPNKGLLNAGDGKGAPIILGDSEKGMSAAESIAAARHGLRQPAPGVGRMLPEAGNSEGAPIAVRGSEPGMTPGERTAAFEAELRRRQKQRLLTERGRPIILGPGE